MTTLLQIDFETNGPWGAEMSAAYAELAVVIAAYPELRWKIWTEDADTKTAGGIYLFSTEEAARSYLAEHTERLAGFGITEIRSCVFDVNEPLSETTRGPLN